MKKFILIVVTLMLVGGEPAWSIEKGKVELVCNGKASDFVNKLIDMDVEGSVVIIDFSSNVVIISDFYGGEYAITEKSKHSISFEGVQNKISYRGAINRYTAQVSLHSMMEDRKSIRHLLNLKCRVGKRLF
jgi:hypothetical protein